MSRKRPQDENLRIVRAVRSEVARLSKLDVASVELSLVELQNAYRDKKLQLGRPAALLASRDRQCQDLKLSSDYASIQKMGTFAEFGQKYLALLMEAVEIAKRWRDCSHDRVLRKKPHLSNQNRQSFLDVLDAIKTLPDHEKKLLAAIAEDADLKEETNTTVLPKADRETGAKLAVEEIIKASSDFVADCHAHLSDESLATLGVAEKCYARAQVEFRDIRKSVLFAAEGCKLLWDWLLVKDETDQIRSELEDIGRMFEITASAWGKAGERHRPPGVELVEWAEMVLTQQRSLLPAALGRAGASALG